MDTYDMQAARQEEENAVQMPSAGQTDTVQQQATYEPQPFQAPPVQPKDGYESTQSVRRSPYENSPYVFQPVYKQERVKAAPKQKSGKGRKAALCILLVLTLLAGTCAVTAFAVSSSWQSRVDALQQQYDSKLEEIKQQLTSTGNTVIISGEAAKGSHTPAQVYAMCADSVVIINAQITYTEYGKTSTASSTGSGFVISADGYVVTNYHVVQGGTSIAVGMNDGSEYPAQIVGYDATNDVALLKVEANGLPYLPMGDSDALIVGDQVAAVGNPLGELTSTLTVGYISAKERDVNTDGFAINMLQTDAAINSGNSGGPLLNMRGEVIGITTAKYSGTSSSGATIEGVGFAIPINDVKDLLSDLMTYGYVNSGYLGVSVSDVDTEAAAYFGMPRGARVEEIVAGYAADRAGIQVKDIIIALGDYTIETVNDLTRALRRFAPGQATTITVYRSGEAMTFKILLDEKPGQTTQQTPQETEPEETIPNNWQGWYEYLKPYFNEKFGQTYDEWFQEFMDRFGQ